MSPASRDPASPAFLHRRSALVLFGLATGALGVAGFAPVGIATLGIVLAAFYILWMYQRTMTGEPSDEVRATVSEITPREIAAVAPMIAIIIALCIFPQAALSLINPSVATVQEYLSVTDPAIGGEG